MKCYALATSFGSAPLEWFVPGSVMNPLRLFAADSINKHQKEITEACDNVQVGEEQVRKVGNYFFYIKKVDKNCIIVATDEELSERQTGRLSTYLLDMKLDKKIVANNIQKYANPTTIEEIKKDLGETQKIMLKNLELIKERGENIEDLMITSQNLQKTSRIFVNDAERLNSCCIII
jgi:anion-transporting  ArsA/GET3 family ATPase